MENRVILKLFFLFVFFLYSYYLYEGIQSPIPALGDSWDYHIPIAKRFLTGEFIKPTDIVVPQQYYPGSSNLFHSLFLFLGIPLTLSNLFAIGVLGVVLYFLGKTFSLSKDESVFFSLSLVSLTLFHRWANSVSIDVWIAVFFCVILILLHSPLQKAKEWVGLGIATGMLIGSKLLAVCYPVFLFLLFPHHLLKQHSLKKILVFFLPVFLFGGFWYLRNLLLVGNPFYPLDILWFKGAGIFKSEEVVWRTVLQYPLLVLHALISEYKLFSLWFFAFPFVLWWKRKLLSPEIKKLSILSLLLFLLFLFFPMDYKPWIMVSSLRYSYPLGIILVLLLFLFAKMEKKQTILFYLCFLNSFSVLTMSYYPKLLFFLPVGYGVWIFLERFVLERQSIR